MPGICVAVNATTSYAGSSRKTTLKLWKSRPAAPRMMTRRGPPTEAGSLRVSKAFLGRLKLNSTLNKVNRITTEFLGPQGLVQDPSSRTKHLVEHRLRQQTGLRVPLARVVRCNQGGRRCAERPTMPKSRFRPRDRVIRC